MVGQKDPNAPKPAVSAQSFFNQTRREALKADNPDMKSTDVTEKLAEEWRNMDAEARAPFVAQAAEDKARFDEDNKSYVPDPAFLKPTKSGTRLQKDPLKPKKPKSAYLFFGDATRKELDKANPGMRTLHPSLPTRTQACTRTRCTFVTRARRAMNRP